MKLKRDALPVPGVNLHISAPLARLLHVTCCVNVSTLIRLSEAGVNAIRRAAGRADASSR